MTASAYIIGICVAIVLLLISAIVANMISFKPDNSDCAKRKVWFWVFAAFCLVLTFVLAYVIEYSSIRVPNRQQAYMTAMCIASVVSPIIYILLGFVLAKINRHGKMGNWF